jgi:peptidoglycan/LPS O-acetylase OafA/YrhL
MVLLHHFSLHFRLEMHVPLLAPALRRGYLGVDLFFVLSGFVISMVYGPWFAAPSRSLLVRWALFLIRRAARLWPLHVVVLTITMLSLLSEGNQFHPLTMLANVLMVQAWGVSTEINSPAWSVSTEWFAYAVFPLLAPILLRDRTGLVLGLTGVVALLTADMLLAPHVGLMRRGQLDIYYNYSILPVLRCLAGFMLGMMAWRIGRLTAARRWFENGWIGPAALALMLVLMLGSSNDLVVYPLLPIIVLGFHFGRGAACRLFAHGPIYRLGVLSYAFYLVHFTILHWFPFGWAPHGIELLAYMAVTILVAAGLHWLIERPCRSLIRHWGETALTRLFHQSGATMPLHGGPG